MKRWTLLLFTSCTLFGSVRAQVLGEIFSQKSSDLKSLTKQIALVQHYIGWIEKGYKIAEEGLTTIGEIKDGEFNLHSVFFNSLSSVNPAVRKYSKVGIIISDEVFIAENFKQVLAIDLLSPGEAHYIKTIYSNIIDACSHSLNELIDVVSDNRYQMKDDERIRRIDRIYDDMEGRIAFTRQVSDETHWLSQQRQAEENDIESIQNLH